MTNDKNIISEDEQKSQTKKRKAGLSAFLSLISSGSGQIYNGEFRKGIIIKIIVLLSLYIWTFLNFKSSRDLLFLSLLLFCIIVLKIYSVIQAIRSSQRLGYSYSLKKFNKSSIYALLIFGFFVLNIALPLTVPKLALMQMTDFHPFRSQSAKDRYLENYDKRAKTWPVPFQNQMVETSFGQTFVRISGPLDAPPLVLLPGANVTSLQWIPNIESLSISYRTYTVDNIYDFGKSVYTQKFKVPDDFVHWLNEVFDSLGLGNNITLGGYSYGGWITSQYALRFPNKLEKIILMAPAATIVQFGPAFLKSALLAMIPHRRYVRKAMTFMLPDLANSGESGRQDVEFITENAYLGLRCFKPKMLVTPTVLTDEELHNFKVPTLFLIGENEKIYSAEDAVQRLKTIAPQIKVQVISNAGHDLSIVQAEMVNSFILDFLKKE
ncbi:alpha/beta fold hydrolase [Acidobacteriota bacterium]